MKKTKKKKKKKLRQILLEKGPFECWLFFSRLRDKSPHSGPDSFETCLDYFIIIRTKPKSVKIPSNIMEKGPFKNFGICCLIYAIKSTFFVRFLFKHVQINCIIMDINPIENEENPSNIMGKGNCITKTCLYSVDPLKPHFYTVKLGFTGVYIIFLISAQKQRLWV